LHSSINLRSNFVEYLLLNTWGKRLKETLSPAKVQILIRIGNKFHVSHILQKEFPIIYNTDLLPLNEERHLDLSVRIDQQRILELVTLTEENVEKVIQMSHYINSTQMAGK